MSDESDELWLRVTINKINKIYHCYVSQFYSELHRNLTCTLLLLNKDGFRSVDSRGYNIVSFNYPNIMRKDKVS